jgi:hypothetical protein
MAAASDRISVSEEWYLYHPFAEDVPLQPYRTARTVWPLSAEELSRTERQAESGNASALNNLGTACGRENGRSCSMRAAAKRSV